MLLLEPDGRMGYVPDFNCIANTRTLYVCIYMYYKYDSKFPFATKAMKKKEMPTPFSTTQQPIQQQQQQSHYWRSTVVTYL